MSVTQKPEALARGIGEAANVDEIVESWPAWQPCSQDWLDGLFSLHGRTAIVTGGASGLGAVIAQGLANAGASVLVADANEQGAQSVASTIKGHGIESMAAPVDVTKTDEVQRTVDLASAEWGKIDILVNCAGIAGRAPADEFDLSLFRKLLDVNLTGTFLFCQAAGRVMLEKGRGSIINIASLMSVVANPGNLGYIASKGGVAALTRGLAVEWAQRGVRVNAIAPGTFTTPMQKRQAVVEPEFYEAYRERHPIGRFGDPKEIVGAAIFLSADASSFVTGHTLFVDGGYTAQ
jgi:gluconate 5-dehydrogenase